MKAYIGQTRGKWQLAWLMFHGYGEATQRGQLPPRRQPWFFDNGAFMDWRAGRDFDDPAYRSDLAVIKSCASFLKPDFLVVPDRVAGGMESLRFSDDWRWELHGVAPRYLALQDGMEKHLTEVSGAFVDYDGAFVGGTMSWKRETGAFWVRWAHARGKPCHIGRVGNANRVEWAKRIGADSIDTCQPLWKEQYLRDFHAAMNCKQVSFDDWAKEIQDSAVPTL